MDLGRQPLVAECQDRPAAVVEVEAGVLGQQIHVGLEVGFWAPDIFPVAWEGIGVDLAAADELGQEVVAEILQAGAAAVAVRVEPFMEGVERFKQLGDV